MEDVNFYYRDGMDTIGAEQATMVGFGEYLDELPDFVRTGYF
jgi:hypothetical protein